MASYYHPIRDITLSTMKLIDEVDPELVVFNSDLQGKSQMPLASSSKMTTGGPGGETDLDRHRLSVNFGVDLLEKKGWGTGIRVPFANKENQELEKILEIRQRKYLVVVTELRDNKDHLGMLEENFNRASEDVAAYQRFLNSRRSQIEEEKNLLCFAERFHSKIKQEKQRTTKALNDTRGRNDRMQEHHDARLKNLYELRDLIEFDREALKEYHDRLEQYKNEKIELGRIVHDDAKIVEGLEKNYVELGAKRKVLKMELDQQAMTTSKCQEQLDRLSQEFRKVYRHRQDMVQLWATNIEAAKRKDAQMQDVADEYFDSREKMRDLTSELDFRERQFGSVQCGIRNLTLQLNDRDKKVSDMRRNIGAMGEILKQLKDGLNEFQSDIRALSNEEKQLRKKFGNVDLEIARQAKLLKKAEQEVAKLRDKLNEVNCMRLSTDQNITELEDLLAEEEKKAELIQKEMEYTRKILWERTNDQKNLTTDILHCDMAIHRQKQSLYTLEAKELSHMEFLAKQSTKVYRIDLECSTLENKLSRAQNESVNPNFFVLQTELKRTKQASKELADEAKYISKELFHLQNLIIKNGKELSKNKAEKEKLNTELLEINMVSNRTQKLMDQADKGFQSLQVDHSLESVNLKRLNDAVKLAREQLFGLSEERKTIHWAVSERKAEIENNRTLNTSKSKALSSAVGKLRVQIHEMDERTEKLKGRFNLVTKLMMDSSQGAANGDDTIAQKVRQAARQREVLQMELQKWEARVQEAKKELVGLENVMKLMHSSNLTVKEKLGPIKEGSIESQELELLEQEEKAIHVRKRRANRFKFVLLDKMEELKQRMAVMDQEIQAVAQLSKMKESQASRMGNELFKGKEKVQRWSNLCCKLLKEVKPTIPKSDYDLLETDLKLKLIQEKFECGMSMLEKLLVSFPELKHFVMKCFANEDRLASVSNIVEGFLEEALTPAERAKLRRSRFLDTTSGHNTAKSVDSGSGMQSSTRKGSGSTSSLDSSDLRRSMNSTENDGDTNSTE